MRPICMIALLAMAACTSAAAPASMLHGTFSRDCAPYDGPAFSVTLPHRASKTQFLLRANVPLEQAAGTWRHSGQSRPGEAMIARCKIGGGGCSYPESGAFRIEMAGAQQMRGTIEVTIAGHPRESFRFEARQQEPKRQWLCG